MIGHEERKCLVYGDTSGEECGVETPQGGLLDAEYVRKGLYCEECGGENAKKKLTGKIL